MKKIRKGTWVVSGDIKGRYQGEMTIRGVVWAQIKNEWSQFGSTTAVRPETVRLAQSSDNA